jgi:hypothetical protein
MKTKVLLIALWFFGLILFPGISFAQKNDTVYLLNGDRITGEIKKYESGILVLSTIAMSTLNIEYDKIGSLHSSKFFEIVTTTGFSYFGSILRSSSEASIDIIVTNDTITEPIKKIVEITPIKNKFWKKFYGTIDLGLSYYKSSNILQYYINTTINHRSKKRLFTFVFNSLFSVSKVSDTSEISSKNDVSLSMTRFYPGRWWLGYVGQFQQNTELDLASRYQLGIGAGYDIIHTNPIRFYFMGGLLGNREKPTDSVSASGNLEGVIAVKFVWLQYRHPKINISTNFNFIPSFTVSNRYRFEYELSTKIEIVKDLYFNLSVYDNYDSKPSGGGGELNDWSVITSIGYTF